MQLNPTEASLGTEQTEFNDDKEETPYDPEKIRDRLADLMRDVAGCTKEEMIQMNDISVKA